MIVKDNKGLTGIDVAISIIIMTMFIAVIGNIIIKLNINKQMLDKESTATSYAIQEIEKIKARGYITRI